jgi:hypothetical protein
MPKTPATVALNPNVCPNESSSGVNEVTAVRRLNADNAMPASTSAAPFTWGVAMALLDVVKRVMRRNSNTSEQGWSQSHRTIRDGCRLYDCTDTRKSRIREKNSLMGIGRTEMSGNTPILV